MSLLAYGRDAFGTRRAWQTILTICGATAAVAIHLTSALAQDNEFPAMGPPPDYVEQGRQREQATCAITGLCNQFTQPGRAAYPDKWTALAISDTTKRAGASHGQGSQDAAVQLALTNCRRNGSLDCKFLLWGSTDASPRAISYPDGAYGWDGDQNRAQAGLKALARCRSAGGKNCGVQTAPCASDDPQWSSPLPLPQSRAGSVADVDPHTVGTWQISVNPGRWVWEIGRNGTYEFHSEAPDGAASHAGTSSAHDGHWSLRATNGYTDGGTYSFQPPDSLIATGRLGTGTWRHLGSAAGN